MIILTKILFNIIFLIIGMAIILMGFSDKKHNNYYKSIWIFELLYGALFSIFSFSVWILVP